MPPENTQTDAAETDIGVLYSLFLASQGITTDTRHCRKGSLFFALKGENFNGNTYAEEALEKGCSFAVVNEEAFAKNKCCILVDDVLLTLQQLAHYHRKKLKTPIIGITGSNGKTTTKELLAAVLSRKFKVHFTQDNLNNHIGVPLTLLQINREHELVIIEMGANHPFEIKELCAIAEPDMGIITNIGKAHLEGFGGIKGVMKTKKELYDFIEKWGGCVFVNAQDELLMSLSENIKRVKYNADSSTFKVEVAKISPNLVLSVASAREKSTIETRLIGEYNSTNVAAVLEIGHYLNIPFPEMKAALEAYVPSNNRSQMLQTTKNKVILDAYNANPASMTAAIDNFSKLEAQCKVVLLGAMKELGEYSVAEHEHLIKIVRKHHFQLSILVGKEFSFKAKKTDNMLFFDDTEALKSYLSTHPIEEATVLIKGSRSIKMEVLLDFL